VQAGHGFGAAGVAACATPGANAAASRSESEAPVRRAPRVGLVLSPFLP
jgi:hypothetical protein